MKRSLLLALLLAVGSACTHEPASRAPIPTPDLVYFDNHETWRWVPIEPWPEPEARP